MLVEAFKDWPVLAKSSSSAVYVNCHLRCEGS